MEACLLGQTPPIKHPRFTASHVVHNAHVKIQQIWYNFRALIGRDARSWLNFCGYVMDHANWEAATFEAAFLSSSLISPCFRVRKTSAYSRLFSQNINRTSPGNRIDCTTESVLLLRAVSSRACTHITLPSESWRKPNPTIPHLADLIRTSIQTEEIFSSSFNPTRASRDQGLPIAAKRPHSTIIA
jgi:hypothetical protein